MALTRGFVAGQAVVRTRHFAFERGSRGDRFVVANVAVQVIRDFIR